MPGSPPASCSTPCLPRVRRPLTPYTRHSTTPRGSPCPRTRISSGRKSCRAPSLRSSSWHQWHQPSSVVPHGRKMLCPLYTHVQRCMHLAGHDRRPSLPPSQHPRRRRGFYRDSLSPHHNSVSPRRTNFGVAWIERATSRPTAPVQSDWSFRLAEFGAS